MDAFYASVEQRDRPELRGKPVAVGGQPTSRGVVAAASYDARAFGEHSAMPMSRAVRLCPDLLIVPPDFGRYKAASDAVFSGFREVPPVRGSGRGGRRRSRRGSPGRAWTRTNLPGEKRWGRLSRSASRRGPMVRPAWPRRPEWHRTSSWRRSPPAGKSATG